MGSEGGSGSGIGALAGCEERGAGEPLGSGNSANQSAKGQAIATNSNSNPVHEIARYVTCRTTGRLGDRTTGLGGKAESSPVKWGPDFTGQGKKVEIGWRDEGGNLKPEMKKAESKGWSYRYGAAPAEPRIANSKWQRPGPGWFDGRFGECRQVQVLGGLMPAEYPHLDTATGGFSLSRPAKRGERVGGEGHKRGGGRGQPPLPGMAASSPRPSPPKEGEGARERIVVAVYPRSAHSEDKPDPGFHNSHPAVHAWAMKSEIIFEVLEAEEGGYCASALGCGITSAGGDGRRVAVQGA